MNVHRARDRCVHSGERFHGVGCGGFDGQSRVNHVAHARFSHDCSHDTCGVDFLDDYDCVAHGRDACEHDYAHDDGCARHHDAGFFLRRKEND